MNLTTWTILLLIGSQGFINSKPTTTPPRFRNQSLISPRRLVRLLQTSRPSTFREPTSQLLPLCNQNLPSTRLSPTLSTGPLRPRSLISLRPPRTTNSRLLSLHTVLHGKRLLRLDLNTIKRSGSHSYSPGNRLWKQISPSRSRPVRPFAPPDSS